MKHIKSYEKVVNEGKHGRFEVYGRKDDEIMVLGYGGTSEIAEDIKKDFDDEEFDELWWEDTHENKKSKSYE